jgi:hypothetical protein
VEDAKGGTRLDYPRWVGDTEHYELSRKTKSRKGEQMKRLALLSVFSLLLVSAVFAPVAMAQESAEVDVQSMRLGPGGSVTVSGTIECIEGYNYNATALVRQKTSGNVINRAQVDASGSCATSEPTAFTVTGFGRVGELEKPFRRGPATVQTFGTLFPPDFSTNIDWQGPLESMPIRR